MRFAFTEDQLAFRDAVRDLLVRECPPSVVRDSWTNATGRTTTVWGHLAEMGVLGALAPEGAGGLGLSFLDLVLVLEEAGYAALPEPLLEHAAVAIPLLPDPAPAVSGATTVTASFPAAPYAPWADTAGVVVVADDTRVRVVARDELDLTAHASVDRARRLYTVDAPPGAGIPVSDGAALERGALGAAAQLIGLTRRMLDLTVEYVSERRQFGVPVGSFQAVKHHLAGARLALEFARPLVYRAAWSLTHADGDTPVHVSMAKATASDAAHLTGRAALQCHGAIGYSYEYDLHLFLKRAWALEGTWGDAPWHRARVGRAIL
ncbi:MAG TPA: acyl-CoA dehydrogenase [Acidimicrobiia bacterium]|nr:acyl-CoA dehydrogenase [Acidimicrobiia bacterium]